MFPYAILKILLSRKTSQNNLAKKTLWGVSRYDEYDEYERSY